MCIFIYQRQVDWDIGNDIFLIMILGFAKIIKLEMKKKAMKHLSGGSRGVS